MVDLQVFSSVRSSVERLKSQVSTLVQNTGLSQEIGVKTSNSSGNFLTSMANIQLTGTITWPELARWATIIVVPDIAVNVTNLSPTGRAQFQGSCTLNFSIGGQTSSINTSLNLPDAPLNSETFSLHGRTLYGIALSRNITGFNITWAFTPSDAFGSISAASYVCSYKAFIQFYNTPVPTVQP